MSQRQRVAARSYTLTRRDSLSSPAPAIDDSNLAESSQWKGATVKTEQLVRRFETEATTYGMAFYDASRAAAMSEIDGIHLDAAEHLRLAQFLAPLIRDEVSQ